MGAMITTNTFNSQRGTSTHRDSYKQIREIDSINNLFDLTPYEYRDKFKAIESIRVGRFTK